MQAGAYRRDYYGCSRFGRVCVIASWAAFTHGLPAVRMRVNHRVRQSAWLRTAPVPSNSATITTSIHMLGHHLRRGLACVTPATRTGFVKRSPRAGPFAMPSAATWRLLPGLPGSGARRWPELGGSLASAWRLSAEIEEGLQNGV